MRSSLLRPGARANLWSSCDCAVNEHLQLHVSRPATLSLLLSMQHKHHQHQQLQQQQQQLQQQQQQLQR
jgi:hypothetical protein